jgi:hypothetical protein
MKAPNYFFQNAEGTLFVVSCSLLGNTAGAKKILTVCTVVINVLAIEPKTLSNQSTSQRFSIFY